MSVQIRRYRIAAFAAVVAAALSVASSPASASPAPDPDHRTAPTSTCPTRSDIAAEMRGFGMSAQGARNIAEFAYRDCIHET